MPKYNGDTIQAKMMAGVDTDDELNIIRTDTDGAVHIVNATGSELDVNIANTPLETTETNATTAGTTTPSIATTNTTILAANANRQGGVISNPGPTTVFVNFSAAATTSHHQLVEGGFIHLKNYTGTVTGVVASGSQTIVATEFE